jgi:ABC-type bacteriocin/lantibiotic exporter with double-glycine peptidase domain
VYERVAPSSRMVKQALPMSCGAACVRQLLLDAGLDIDEGALREQARFDPVSGIEGRDLARVLEMHLGPSRYAAGAVPPEQLDLLTRFVPFLALVRAPGRHWIIVDRLDEEHVYVRDPAGPDNASVGVEGVMLRTVFLDRWRRMINGAVYRL